MGTLGRHALSVDWTKVQAFGSDRLAVGWPNADLASPGGMGKDRGYGDPALPVVPVVMTVVIEFAKPGRDDIIDADRHVELSLPMPARASSPPLSVCRGD